VETLKKGFNTSIVQKQHEDKGQPKRFSRLDEISATFEAKPTKSVQRVEIDHPEPEEMASKAD
jgi:hypothetical protein